MRSYQQFFAELKRRRVFKVAAVYGAVAFVLLQVADLLGQGLRLPESFMPFMTAVILLGFPLAIILAWAFEVTPEGVMRTGAASPGEIEALVAEPASKRWPAGILAALGIAALLAGAWWAGRTTAPGVDRASAEGDRAGEVQLAFADPGDDPRPSLAVLPFLNLSSEEEQEYFSDGMTEEILGTLAKIRELRVAARTSAFAYKGQSRDLREIGRELGVRYLIEGSVRKAGNQLRITAQLIDAEDGSHVWSEQYDRPMDDIFAIQTEIAEAIAGELRVPLGLDGGERLVTPTGDLTAYDLYLAGRAKMRARGASLLEAMEMFQAAIARDSNWAPAWAALAEAREIRIFYADAFEGEPPDSSGVQAALDEAEQAATRALELDPGNASALVALASVLRDRGRWQESEATYRRALSIDPDNAEAHQQYGELLREVGRLAESVRALDRAATLDPALIRISILQLGLVLDDRAAEAVEVVDIGLARDSAVTLPRLWGGAYKAYLAADRYEEAGEVLAHLFENSPPQPWREPGERPTADDAREYVKALVAGDASSMPESIRPWLTPEDWMRLGQPDTVMAMLPGDKVAIRGFPGGTNLWYPALDPLRDRPEFEALIDRAKVPRRRPLRTPPGERTRPLFLQRHGAGEAAP